MGSETGAAFFGGGRADSLPQGGKEASNISDHARQEYARRAGIGPASTADSAQTDTQAEAYYTAHVHPVLSPALIVGADYDLSTGLQFAYNALHAATIRQGAAELAQFDAQAQYQTERGNVLRAYAGDVKALGANEETREARIVELLAGIVERKQAAERAALVSRQVTEVARLGVERQRALLRIAELSAPARALGER